MTCDSSLYHGGIAAGLLATVPMTFAMRAMHRQLPPHDRYPLPPELLTAETVKIANIEAEPEAPGWEWKTYASHFSYGAVMGVGYAAIEPVMPGSPAIKGAVFGFGVWAGSYLGWIPLFNMPAAAKDESNKRNAMMITAHLVWGIANGLGYAKLVSPGKRK
jgi:uncharacterized membrane protein YagU involved in acid resistance